MEKETAKYHVLTPKTDLEESVYFGAIDFALKDKSVHNLAVSGPYGAGKSSVIHSYINKRKADKARVIEGKNQINDVTITLAHLRANTDNGDGINPNLIEYSILEQLFFHENGVKLPESQFSRIKPLSLWDLFAYVFYIVFFGACVFAWFYRDTLGLDYPGYMALVIFSVLSSYAIYKLLPMIRNLTVRKISLATASIEIGDGVEQSVLNKHLDEILYYFQQTGINMVVFEDLDRFDNPDLFVKLREINYLINNAATIEQNVVFVYALRDDMFLNRQRTKFFDFIVPIIPFVDGKNAVDKLYVELEGSGIDARLCQVISYHVGEMRMVYNIVNEYQIYKALKTPVAQYNENRMLAIVAYKNCYPKDFAALLEHKGILYAIMTKKKDVVKGEREILNARIAELEQKLKLIQLHHHSSIHALRLEYINELLNAIPNVGARLGAFEEIRSLDDWASDELFNEIIKGTTINYVFQQPRLRTIVQNAFQYNFKDIENIVDAEHSYSEREQIIKNRENVDDIEKEINQLRSDVAFLDESKYVSLLDDGHSIKNKFSYKDFEQYAESADSFAEQVELIEDLLSFDFINENYMEYVSLFHTGTLGPKDNRFLIDVLRHKHNDYGYELEKADMVVDKMNASLFLETSAWWNFDLVDAMMNGAATRDKIENMVACLSETDEHLNFINEYIQKGKNVDRFMEEMCTTYTDIWRNMKASRSADFDKERWLELIIRNTSSEQIAKIIDKNEPTIANMPNYFHIPNVPIDHLYNVATILDIKFTSISADELTEHKEFIANNNLYVIIPDMLRCVLAIKDNDYQFEYANYTYLRNSGKDSVIEYVEKNLSEYVRNVLLEMPTNTHEKSLHESALLSSNELSIDLKERLIEKGMEKWDSVEQWEDQTQEVQLMLYRYKRVKVTWENVLYLFGLDKQEFVNYVKQESVVLALQKSGVPNFEGDVRKKWEDMQKAIVTNRELAFVGEKIIDYFDIAFEQVTIMNCDRKILNLLVKRGKIARGVPEFEVLYSVDRDMAWRFFVKYFDYYKKHMSEINPDEYDINILFHDKFGLSVEQRLHILENIDAEKYVTEYNFNTLAKFFMSQEIVGDLISGGIKNAISIMLCLENEPTLIRIRLFNKYPVFATKDDLDYWVSTFENAYIEQGKLKHRIPYSPEAHAMCTKLRKRGYIKSRRRNIEGNFISITFPEQKSHFDPLYWEYN